MMYMMYIHILWGGDGGRGRGEGSSQHTVVAGLPCTAPDLRDGKVNPAPKSFRVVKQRPHLFKLGAKAKSGKTGGANELAGAGARSKRWIGLEVAGYSYGAML